MDHIDEMIKLHKKCRIQVSAMDFCRRPENTLEVRGVKWLCIASSCCPSSSTLLPLNTVQKPMHETFKQLEDQATLLVCLCV